MIKPDKLNEGDQVAIVSLSAGVLGESFVKHELDLAIKRLKDFGLEPVIMPNALVGIEELKAHPEKRAEDLKTAFATSEIKAVFSAIGGNDTYKTLPFLMNDAEFIQNVKNHPKIFCGFSDTTINHLMFYRLGLETFYGPAVLTDWAELGENMLPYTKEYLQKFFDNSETTEITPSTFWYEDRKSYGPEELGKARIQHDEKHQFEVLNGKGVAEGRLYGGCIDSIYNAMTGERFPDEQKIIEESNILLSLEEYADKILFLETSDERPTPAKLSEMLKEFRQRQILDTVQGIIFGKPIDETYYEEYKTIIRETFAGLDTPVLYNVNFGHSVPRCILPYGAQTVVDYDAKTITIVEKLFSS